MSRLPLNSRLSSSRLYRLPYTARVDFAEVRRTNRGLVKVAKLYRGAQAELLADLGLHPGQDVLLWVLGQEPDGLLVSELAERLGIESPTVTRTLARLESGGWFVRERVSGDRRAVRIRLTVHARRTLPHIEDQWRKLAETATAGLKPDEREQLVMSLERVRDNLLALTTGEQLEAAGSAAGSIGLACRLSRSQKRPG